LEKLYEGISLVSYMPIRTPARKLLATHTPLGTPPYTIPEENHR